MYISSYIVLLLLALCYRLPATTYQSTTRTTPPYHNTTRRAFTQITSNEPLLLRQAQHHEFGSREWLIRPDVVLAR